MVKGRTQKNEPQSKKGDDDIQDLTPERWHIQEEVGLASTEDSVDLSTKDSSTTLKIAKKGYLQRTLTALTIKEQMEQQLESKK